MSYYPFDCLSLKTQESLAGKWRDKIKTSDPSGNMLKNANLAFKEEYGVEDECAMVIHIDDSFLKICEVKNSQDKGKKIITNEYVINFQKNIKEDVMCNINIWIWIVQQILIFCRKYKKEYSTGYLAISYPLERIGENDYRILNFKKKFLFDKKSFENKNPIEEINKNCKKFLSFDLEFKGVINDSVATAVAAHYNFSKGLLGVIVGTDTNGSIIKENKEGKRYIFDTEWTNFEGAKFITNAIDLEIIDELVKNGIAYNLLDVIAGESQVMNYCRKIAKSVYNYILPEDMKLEDIYYKKEVFGKLNHLIAKKVLKIFKKRSNGIIASMILGTLLSLEKIDDEVCVVLNIKTYRSSKEKERFIASLNKLKEKMEVKTNIN
ncbi:hypothetical protein H311_01720, partial [Anncaliia algerae PRA109]